MLADTPLLTEDLEKQFGFCETEEYVENLRSWETKFAGIDPDIFQTPALKDGNWKEANGDNRHIICRHAAHGFHHRLCAANEYHEPNDSCICPRCGQRCPRYHAVECAPAPSLKQLSSMLPRLTRQGFDFT